MSDVPSTRNPTHLSHPATFPPGRLGMMVALGAAGGILPLPYVPAKVLESVRGALVHDVVTRHGLTISPEARAILAAPDTLHPKSATAIRIGAFVASVVFKRLGPIALVSPAVSAVELFGLGHLLDRYLEEVRASSSVRLHAEEARKIRALLDRTLLRCLSPSLAVPPEGRADGAPAEDGRTGGTRIVDAAVLAVASVPAYLVRRLDTAFAVVVEESRRAPSEQAAQE